MIPQTQVEIFISKWTEISRGLTLLSFPLSWGDYRGRIYSNIGTTGVPILCTVFASVYRWFPFSWCDTIFCTITNIRTAFQVHFLIRVLKHLLNYLNGSGSPSIFFRFLFFLLFFLIAWKNGTFFVLLLLLPRLSYYQGALTTTTTTTTTTSENNIVLMIKTTALLVYHAF